MEHILNKLNEMKAFLDARDVAHWNNAAKENGHDESIYAPFHSELEIDVARKYIKVYRKSKTSCCIFMFVDMEGNIYKPASSKAPAKGIRGHVNDWMKSLTIYPKTATVCVNYNR